MAVAKVSLPITGVPITMRRDPLDRERWARLRFAIIGPLLAAPPPPGQLQTILRELAARTWQHPGTGLPVRFGVSTIERWYYAAQHAPRDPVAALQTRVRCDVGQPRVLTPTVIAALQALLGEAAADPEFVAMLQRDFAPLLDKLPKEVFTADSAVLQQVAAGDFANLIATVTPSLIDRLAQDHLHASRPARSHPLRQVHRLLARLPGRGR